jgi:hypothetical protein
MGRLLTPLPPEVADVLNGFPTPVRRQLLEVRGLIFDVAAKSDGVGPLTETLRWGEPAYLTEVTGSGSTVRLGWKKSSERSCAILFNCRTPLVDTFRSEFPGVFVYEKNRAILLSASTPLPKAPLSICLCLALTYHRRRRQ